MAEGPLQRVGVRLCQALEESSLQSVAILLQVHLQQCVYSWDDTPSMAMQPSPRPWVPVQGTMAPPSLGFSLQLCQHNELGFLRD